MFGRVYTAPPQEIFFDMDENDASFDEAAKNLYDQELEQGFDTASLDEFLEPSIEDFDDAAVEKAIYQTAIAQEQGRNPTEITTTPYGLGLLQDEYDEIINIYPGIGAGMEWRTMDDHYHDAEEMLNDPRAGTSISNLIDVAVEKAEDEGAIDSLGDIFKAFGEQLGRAGQSAAEAHVDSRTELDTDTGDLFLGPSVGPNPPWEVLDAVANTAKNIVGVFGDGEGRPPDMDMGGPPPDADPVDQLMEIFEKILVGQTSNRNILRDIHRSFLATTDHDLFAEAIRAWINTDDWSDKVGNAGAKPRDLFNELTSVFSQGAGASYEGADTFQWSGDLTARPRPTSGPSPGDPTARPQPTKTEVDVSEEEKKKSKRQNRIDVLKKEYEDRGTPISDEEAGVIVDAGEGEGEEGDREAIIKDLMESGIFDREEAEEFADYKISRIAVDPSEMRERHTRALSKAFYETIYAQPWGGRAEFASLYPAMLSETKTLFLLNAFTDSKKNLTRNTTPGLLVQEYGESPELGAAGELSPVGDAYKTFLNKYLQNPSMYRTGARLAGQIARINELLRKRIEEPGVWTDKEDRDDWLWIEPMFWGTDSEAKVNRYNLITMVAARGQQGYMANILKAGTSRAIEHYENMGYAGSEIFALMTSVFGRTGGSISAEDTPIPPDSRTGDDGEEKLVDDQETRATGGGKPRYRPVIPKSRPATYQDLSGIELDPRAFSVEEPTDLDRDIDRILTRGSVPSPANALLQNRMQFHGETPSQAVAWVNENMPNFPDQPGADFIEGDYAQFGVDPSLSRSDIGDILTDFDLGAETMVLPPSRVMGPPDASDSTLLPVSMSRDDIADILADFDMGVEMSIPPSRRMGPSQYPGEFVM